MLLASGVNFSTELSITTEQVPSPSGRGLGRGRALRAPRVNQSPIFRISQALLVPCTSSENSTTPNTIDCTVNP